MNNYNFVKGDYLQTPNVHLFPQLKENELRVFLALCLHADKNGQCFPSRQTLADVCGFGEKKTSKEMVSTALRVLRKLGMIRAFKMTRKNGSQTSNFYQIMVVEPPRFSDTPLTVELQGCLIEELDPPSNSTVRPHNNTNITTPIKDTNNIYPQNPPKGNFEEEAVKEEYSEDFLKFYKVFPKKKEKDEAYKAWKKRKFTAKQVEEVIESVENYKKSEDWQKDNGQFIPYPATYLNKGKYKDEIEPVKDKILSDTGASLSKYAKYEDN